VDQIGCGVKYNWYMFGARMSAVGLCPMTDCQARTNENERRQVGRKVR